MISDLLATQLLYPALLDSGLGHNTIDETLTRNGQPLTEAVVARLHASTPNGTVIHIHDLLGWWDGHPQPTTIEMLLDLAASDPEAAVVLAADCEQPYGCDPRLASTQLGATIIETAFWRWPFAPGTDYLVCATVVRRHDDSEHPQARSRSLGGSLSRRTLAASEALLDRTRAHRRPHREPR